LPHIYCTLTKNKRHAKNEANVAERDIAHYAQIKDILNKPIIEQESSPSSIQLGNTNASRIRIYGIIVSQDPLIIDDGTGNIIIRNFDQTLGSTLGDFVLCIGRPRSHAGEPYILGEILKKTNPKWKTYYEKIQASKQTTTSNPLDIIRELDKGDGANFEDVAKKLGTKGEDIITSLLAKGDIFETRPGKLKILE
jgi:hypothetical protein